MYAFLALILAALPPLAQSTKEIQAVLEDSQLQTALKSSEAIQGIFRTQNGYLIITQNSLLPVHIEYGAQQRLGPRPFQIHFQRSIDLQNEGLAPTLRTQ